MRGPLDLVRVAKVAPARPGSVEDEAAHALGMPGRVRDHGGPPTGKSEEREALESRGIDHRGQIAHVGVERRSALEPAVGQPAATLVIADERAPSAQLPDPVAPHRAVPLVIEVGHPVARLDQRRPFAIDRIGEADAVERGAEASLVPHRDDRIPSRAASRLRAYRHSLHRDLGAGADGTAAARRESCMRPICGSSSPSEAAEAAEVRAGSSVTCPLTGDAFPCTSQPLPPSTKPLPATP
jgi:hypothetical protein